MGQVLHGSATTTEAVRRAIQHSQESLRALAKRYGINQKTVAKWRERTSTADLLTGPKEPRSTVLSVEEEAVIVAFRRYTLLPLDDCLYALQPTIPHLTRSSASSVRIQRASRFACATLAALRCRPSSAGRTRFGVLWFGTARMPLCAVRALNAGPSVGAFCFRASALRALSTNEMRAVNWRRRSASPFSRRMAIASTASFA